MNQETPRIISALKFFKELCEEYNSGELSEYLEANHRGCISIYRVYHSATLETFTYIKNLWGLEKNSAAKESMVSCGKLLIRLSYLKEHQRIETEQERNEYLSKLYNDYGLHLPVSDK